MTEKDLHKIKNQKPFKVPEGYFDDKRKDLYAIASSDVKKLIPIWKKTYVWSSGIAALLVVSLFFYKPSDDIIPAEETNLSALTEDEIETYLMGDYSFGEEAIFLNDEDIELDFEDWDL